MAVRHNRTDKIEISLQKRIKFQKARGLYLNSKSDCYLSAPKALERAGYAKSSAGQLAPLLFVQTETTPEIRLDPENMAGLVEELNKWLTLMAKWRVELEDVESLVKLPPAVFSTISAHIERLAKILGVIKEQAKGTTINIQINTLPNTEQYEKLKLMLPVLFAKVRTLEGQLEIDEKHQLILN